MSKIMISIVVPVLVLFVALEGNFVSAQSSGEDCTTAILVMTECLGFVANDSTITKPDDRCCSGVKTVIETNPECICGSSKQFADMDITISLEKADALPSLCGLIVPPSAGNCKLFAPPGAAPVNPPKKHDKSQSPTKSSSVEIPAAPPSGETVDNQTPVPVSDSAAAPSGETVNNQTPAPVSDSATAPSGQTVDNQTPSPVSGSAAAPVSEGLVDNQTPSPVSGSAPAPVSEGPADTKTPPPVSDSAVAPNSEGPVDTNTLPPVSDYDSTAPSASPSSSGIDSECAPVMFSMTSCVTAVNQNSKPNAECCNQLKEYASCFCYFYDYVLGGGYEPKVITALPSACGVTLPPSAGTCAVGATSDSLGPSEGPSKADAFAPSPPTKSDSSAVAISFVALIAGLAVASASY